MDIIYFAGGCLWGVQAFMKTLPGVINTEAGRANGDSKTLTAYHDGYVECVKTEFNSSVTSTEQLISYFFEIINPYSLNQQGDDVGLKYRTGIYSDDANHLNDAHRYINNRSDKDKILVEVLPLTNYVRSAEEHQDRLSRCPDDYCHISTALLNKYK